MTGHTQSQTRYDQAMFWFGVLGGPVVWLLHLLAAYAIAEFGCISRLREVSLLGITAVAWLLIVISLLLVGVAAAATYAAYQSGGRFRELDRPTDDEPDSRISTARIGLVSSSLFFFIIIVESVPIFFHLRNC